MKSAYASAIVLTLSALAASQAFAGSSAARYDETFGLNTPAFTPTKTRDQVRAELADAQRTGNIVLISSGEKNGAKVNQLFATNYPAQVAAPTKTREQVRAELTEAQRTGDIVLISGGEKNGAKLNQLYPTNYPTRG